MAAPPAVATTPTSVAQEPSSVAPTTAPTTQAAPPAVTSTTPPAVTPSTTSSAAVVTPSTTSTPAVVTSSTPTSSSAAAATTSSSTSSAAAPSSSSATSSSVAMVTITTSVSQPGLVTSVTPSSRTSSATSSSASLGESNSKGGVANSGLSVGAFVGIIIGGLAVLIAIAIVATRSIRKRNRTRRTAQRSSMFEPWPAPAPVSMEDPEPYEKPGAYAMDNRGAATSHNNYDNYGGGGAYPGAESQPLAYQDPSGYPYQSYGQETYDQYPPQVYANYPAGGGYDSHAYAAGAAGVGTGVAAAAAAVPEGHGLQDGMMVRVKVGFVRSLEDELAITPGQQLYLHQAYDDGWSLCEDQNHNKGVVPVSCLEPWHDSLAPVSGEYTEQTARRRSSLYQNAQAAGQYLNMQPGHGQ